MVSCFFLFWSVRFWMHHVGNTFLLSIFLLWMILNELSFSESFFLPLVNLELLFPKDIIMFLDAHVRPAEGWSWIDNLAIELKFHVIQSSFFGPIFRLASTAFEAYQPELQAYLVSINHFYGQLRELPDLGLRCCGAVDSYLGFEHLGNGSQCRGGEDDVILASLDVVGLVRTCVGWLLLI